MEHHRCAPLVYKHNISITGSKSTGLPYQRMKEPIIVCCRGYNALLFFRTLQQRYLSYRESGIIQTCYPLWFTIRFSVSLSDIPIKKWNRYDYLDPPHGNALRESAVLRYETPSTVPIIAIKTIWSAKYHTNGCMFVFMTTDRTQILFLKQYFSFLRHRWNV